MSSNKRVDERFDSRQELWCEGQSKTLQTRNISKNGMFVVAEEPREVGEEIKVAFEGDEGPIEVKMQVMWSDPPKADGPVGMGLRIVGFDKGQDAYERFVNRHLKEAKGEPGESEAPEKK